MANKILIFAGVIFVGGLIYFNGQVADACTHGNCVHGWSSKNTQAEQNNSRMWFIGFPLFIFLIYLFVNRDTETKPSSKPTNKKTKYDSKTFWKLDFSGSEPKWVEVNADWHDKADWQQTKTRLQKEHKQATQNHKETEKDVRRKKTYERLDAFIKKQEEKE